MTYIEGRVPPSSQPQQKTAGPVVHFIGFGGATLCRSQPLGSADGKVATTIRDMVTCPECVLVLRA